MKRIIMLVICSVILVSCGTTGSTSNVDVPTKQTSDGKYILVSLDGKDILADEFYADVLNSANAGSMLYSIIVKQGISNAIPKTDAMEKDADMYITSIEENWKSYYGDNWKVELDAALLASGYKSWQQFKEDYIFDLQKEVFYNNFFEENFDELFERYYETKQPRIVSHILVSIEDFDEITEEEQKKLDEVIALVNQGVKSFGEIARDYSDDPGSALEDGLLGFVDADGLYSYNEEEGVYSSTQLVTEFQEASMELGNGEISELIKTTYGYHFIKVDTNIKEDIKEMDEMESRIRDFDAYIDIDVFESFVIEYTDQNIKTIVDKYIENRKSNRKAATE